MNHELVFPSLDDRHVTALASLLAIDGRELRRLFNALEFSSLRMQELKAIVDYVNDNMRRGKPRLVKTGALTAPSSSSSCQPLFAQATKRRWSRCWRA